MKPVPTVLLSQIVTLFSGVVDKNTWNKIENFCQYGKHAIVFPSTKENKYFNNDFVEINPVILKDNDYISTNKSILDNVSDISLEKLLINKLTSPRYFKYYGLKLYQNSLVQLEIGEEARFAKIGTEIGSLLLIIIIILVVKARQKRDKNEKLLIGAPVDAYSIKNNKFEVENSDLGLEFSMTMWIYISDWTQGWKNILIKGDKKTTPNNSSARAPGLWLYPNTNALHARINTFAAVNEGCDIKNIPLQKWVCIAYILNNRTVDIYINGKLERSCVLRGVPKLNNAPIHICENGGFFGKISNVKYFRYALQPDKVHSIYSSGPY